MAERWRGSLASLEGGTVVVANANDPLIVYAAELAPRVVFTDPAHDAAREALAGVYERLAYGAENGTWRNVYLSGATELRSGKFGTPASAGAPDILGALSVEQVLGALAVRVDGPRAWN